MLNRLRQAFMTMSLAVLGLSAITVPLSAQSNHTLLVENNSGFDIYEIHMSSVNDRSWERDLLGSGILFDGNSFTVTAPPGVYDLRVVDEDHDACVVSNVRVYEDMTWNLTPGGLLGCEFR